MATKVKLNISSKRERCYWDPIYNPGKITSNFIEFDWNTQNFPSINKAICHSAQLKQKVGQYQWHTIKDTTFECCDFEGEFNFINLTFRNCTFKDCDFKTALWDNVKFSQCTFESTSISTTKFSNCQFNKCQWKRIGISSNEMHFLNTKISNPYEFIKAAFTNTDKSVLGQFGTTPAYQLFRLEGTKAKVARMLLSSIQDQGDDDAYYDGLKAQITQSLSSKIANHNYHRNQKSGTIAKLAHGGIEFALHLEKILTNISGTVNGWGGKLGRAIIFGLTLIIFFGLLYRITGFFNGTTQSAIASIEITLLVGYTKYNSINDSLSRQLLMITNMLLGLWWYTIFVPTLINRISRAK